MYVYRSVDPDENSLKRVRMVSEGSQTNQHPTTSSVAGASNVAVVPAAQIAPRLQETPAAESHVPVQSVPEVKDTPVAVIASSAQPSTSSAVDGRIFIDYAHVSVY